MLEVKKMDKDEHIICTICSKQLSFENLIPHINTIPHILNYLVS